MRVSGNVTLSPLVVRDTLPFRLDRCCVEASEQDIFLEGLDRPFDCEKIFPLFWVACVLHAEHRVQPFLQLLSKVSAIHSHVASPLDRSYFGPVLMFIYENQGVSKLAEVVVDPVCECENLQRTCGTDG